MENKPNVALRIKNLRTKAGLKQEELAKKIGETKNKVANWELGRTTIPAEVIIKIADALDVNTSKLLPSKKSVTDNIDMFFDMLNYMDAYDFFNRIYDLKSEYQQILNGILEVLEEMQRYEKEKEDDEEILIAASGAENLTDEEREYNIELGKKYYELAHKDDK